MSSTLELPRLDTFVYGKLAADSAITALITDSLGPRIFADSVEEGRALPAIVWQVQDPGDDMRSVGSYRIASRPLILVKAIAETRSWQGDLRTLADRIDAVLDRSSGTNVESLLRIRPFRLAESSGGLEFRHLGALFRAVLVV